MNRFIFISQDEFRLIVLGIVCMIVGLLAPGIISAKDFAITTLANHSINTGGIGSLLLASVRLVALNALRSLPIYIGVLLLAEGLGNFKQGRPCLSQMLPLLLIPVIYHVIYLIYGVVYDFGVPAIAMMLFVLIANRMENMTRRVFHKVTVLALLLFGVEWLDIVPMLTRYHFGHGLLSMHIKQIADLNNATDALNLIGISLFVIFVSNAFLLARLLNVYTLEIKAVEQALAFKQLNSELEIQALENRSLREMQSLVHDLKTPLTSILGLAGVISISGNLDAVKKHADYISSLVDKMTVMIDELLKDDNRQVITVKELVDYAVAHVPQLDKIPRFVLDVKADALVNVNKIKVARTIINLLENSLAAVELGKGYIILEVDKKEDFVVITVKDNGRGFVENDKKEIWNVGFSSIQSTGLGLPFVRDIIEKHGGSVSADNNSEGGAKVVIMLPEVSFDG